LLIANPFSIPSSEKWWRFYRLDCDEFRSLKTNKNEFKIYLYFWVTSKIIRVLLKTVIDYFANIDVRVTLYATRPVFVRYVCVYVGLMKDLFTYYITRLEIAYTIIIHNRRSLTSSSGSDRPVINCPHLSKLFLKLHNYVNIVKPWEIYVYN